MADYTLTQSLQLLRDRLTVMGQFAVTESVQTTPYAAVTDNTYPRVQFYIASASAIKRTSDTMQDVPIVLDLVVLVNEVEAGYEGERQEDMQFTILPYALQYFIEHPNFKYQAGQAGIPYLDELNTRLTSVTTGVQRRGTVQLLTITFSWEILFTTSFSIKC
jgi:hypothetical protein